MNIVIDLDSFHAVAWCIGTKQANHEDCEAKSLVGFCIQHCKFCALYSIANILQNQKP